MLFLSGCTANGSHAECAGPMEQLWMVIGRITRMVWEEGGTSADIVKLITFVAKTTTGFPSVTSKLRCSESYLAMRTRPA